MPYQIANSDNIPVIVAGDFNVPSDEDWTVNNRAQHFGLAVQWPVTMLLKSTGMMDSFRVVHPDPITDPGITWSVFTGEENAVHEVMDRIDFIFYKGTIKPKSSVSY
ncbi:hypothetical protein PFISCL1PPCAC_25274 [Pristionchus fissidentatus]|uniref:Endonuclease/exonuclease/phosphatase domain-containing protein n=1 Tax=Pristionchus fissidentatus TaxID=1538716 RepID=A0AAV5WSD6_9BILA|nr:hypothetical protein PFISCL1PPCAC_25274 [Pristionchus fissidentatus]